MYTLLIFIIITALVIAVIEFPPIIKDKRYGNLAVVFSMWLLAITLSSYLAMGMQSDEPLSRLVDMAPPLVDPIWEFLLPD